MPDLTPLEKELLEACKHIEAIRTEVWLKALETAAVARAESRQEGERT